MSWLIVRDRIGIVLSSDGMVYSRIDGTVTPVAQHDELRRFKNYPACQVLLASIAVVGVGLNITCADTAYIMASSIWNPV